MTTNTTVRCEEEVKARLFHDVVHQNLLLHKSMSHALTALLSFSRNICGIIIKIVPFARDHVRNMFSIV